MVKSNSFMLTLSKVEKILFQDLVMSVTVPGSEGQLTILAHHEPLITVLKEGMIVVTEKDGVTKKTFPILHGVAEISENQTTILV